MDLQAPLRARRSGRGAANSRDAHHHGGPSTSTLDAISSLTLTPAEFTDACRDPFLPERLADDSIALVVIDGPEVPVSEPGSLPVVLAYLGDTFAGDGPENVDLTVDADHLAHLTGLVSANPSAAISLVVLLRTVGMLRVDLALGAESAVYSMLQSSSEFGRWRGDTPPALHDEDNVVEIDRHDDELSIILNRPERHNAVTRALRDALCDALRLAVADDSIRSVRMSGRGPSFCSGGDLAEFGSRPDPALAHRVRLSQSPARLLHHLRNRTIVEIHGRTLGGGIEMAAFAGTVTADAATLIGLPEVSLGLIPGAGGTVSLTRRIGRQRVAALALATESIDAETALAWGLVDEIDEIPRSSSATHGPP